MAPRKPPPYIQLEATLRFLKTALRQDTILLQYFGTPDRILKATHEFAPVRKDKKGKLVWDTELPMLAIEDNASTDVLVGSAEGEEVDQRLWYVFKPHAGTKDVPRDAWAQRISKMIWWRIKYWLRQGRFDHLGQPFDLCRDGKIHHIEALRVTRFVDIENNLEGFLGTLQMVHYQDPFLSAGPVPLKKVQVDQYQETVDPVVGPIVKADIAVPTPAPPEE